MYCKSKTNKTANTNYIEDICSCPCKMLFFYFASKQKKKSYVATAMSGNIIFLCSLVK